MIFCCFVGEICQAVRSIPGLARGEYRFANRLWEHYFREMTAEPCLTGKTSRRWPILITTMTPCLS